MALKASTWSIMDVSGASRNFTVRTYVPFEAFFIAGVIYLGCHSRLFASSTILGDF